MLEERPSRPFDLPLRDRARLAETPAEQGFGVPVGVGEVVAEAAGVLEALGKIPGEELLAGLEFRSSIIPPVREEMFSTTIGLS